MKDNKIKYIEEWTSPLPEKLIVPKWVVVAMYTALFLTFVIVAFNQ